MRRYNVCPEVFFDEAAIRQLGLVLDYNPLFAFPKPNSGWRGNGRERITEVFPPPDCLKAYPGKEVFPEDSGFTEPPQISIRCTDPSTMLIHSSGACAHNGLDQAQGGWAFLRYESEDAVVCGRLEDKGPFGHRYVPTSHRAELRAVIAALRHCNWSRSGYRSLVVVTDSTYVFHGIKEWSQTLRYGLERDRIYPIGNEDLWQVLLTEAGAYTVLGLKVSILKVPREWINVAGARAKWASQRLPPVENFYDA